MRANKLKLNLNKTEVLLVNGRSNPGFKVLIVLVWVAHSLKEHMSSLRVLLDPVQLLDKQVTAVAWRAF